MEKIQAGNVSGDVIVADISGNNEGMIAVGKYILQVQVREGATAYIKAPEQAPEIHARVTPIRAAVRPFNELLDRTAETAQITADLVTRQTVEIYGAEGFGKTALLQVLAYHTFTEAFPDGVVYFEMHARPPLDLLKELYDAFYETSIPYHPGEVKMRQAIAGKQALVLVDEVNAARRESELRGLANAAPGCAFVFASDEQRLWGEGRPYPLTGLPEAEARQLFERGLGRALADAEIPSVLAICTALKGNPLHILQSAGLVKNNPAALDLVAAQLREPGLVKRLAAALLGGLTPPEERVLAVLAGLRGAPVEGRHIPKVTRNPAALALLAALQARGIVQAHGSAPAGVPAGVPAGTPQVTPDSAAFSLPGPLLEQAAQIWNLTPERVALLRYFTGWAQEHITQPAALLQNAAPLQALLEWAAETARWKEVLHLTYLYEKALILSGRWSTWEEALGLAFKAAVELGDQAGQAWVLHQAGTRAMCLGDTSTARDNLVRALRLRRQIGDRAGAAVTRHNLELLLPPPLNDDPDLGKSIPHTGAPVALPFPVTWLLGILVALWMLGAISLGILAWPLRFSPAPAATVIGPVAAATPPTLTPTLNIPTAVQSPTALVLPVPASITPTPSSTLPPPTLAPTITACVPFSNWPVYIVHPGDTLYRLAIRTSSSVAELMRANCKTDTVLMVGQGLRVPRLPATLPAPSITPSVEPTRDSSSNVVVTTPAPITIEPTTPVPTTPIPTTPVPTTPVPLPDLWIADVARTGPPDPTTEGLMDVVLVVVIENLGEGPTGLPFNVTLNYRIDPDKYQSDQPRPRPGGGIGIVREPVNAKAAYQQDIVLKNVDRAWQGNWMEIFAVVNRCADGGAIPCPIEEASEQNNISIFSILIPSIPPEPVQ